MQADIPIILLSVMRVYLISMTNANKISAMSFPLNCRRGFAGNIIDDAVNAMDFIDNSVGNLV